MTDLHDAARSGDLSALRTALAGGAPLDALDEREHTPLACAVHANQPDALALLLDAGAALDAHTPLAWHPWQPGAIPAGYPRARKTLLHEAALSAADAVVPLLVARGVAVAARDSQGVTALTYAAQRGSAGAVAALLAAGADPNARDAVEYCPLDYVSNAAVAEQLLAAGASPDGGRPSAASHTSGYYRRPLLLRASPEVVAALLRGGARPARHPGAVAWHAHYGNESAVAALLAAGADPDDAIDNSPALASAAAFAHRAIVERLLAAGATARDAALYTACGRSLSWGFATMDDRREDRVAILAALLAAGADPNAPVGDGQERALHVAANTGLHEAVALLCRAGAEVDAPNAVGHTPLALAAEHGHAEVVARLLAAGADARRRDREGRSPADIARASRAADHRLVATLRAAAGDPATPAAPAAPAAPAGPSPGASARHAKFGEGRVTAVTGTGEEAKVTVQFASGETRTLLARFLTFA